MMSGLARKLGLPENSPLTDLAEDLRVLAKAFLKIALTSPLGLQDGPAALTNNERYRRIETDIVKPIEKIQSVLSEQKLGLLSVWPNLMNAKPPKLKDLSRQLELLHEWALETIAELDDRASDRGKNRTEFEMALGSELLKLFRSRLSMHPAETSSYDRQDNPSSYLYTFIRAVTDHIFPIDALISLHLLRQVAKDFPDRSHANSA
ncbi:hypothetical protein DX908_14085 [Parvularcula marina]|uniref:Uncharacterized protein n=2 Tax=Parvularcula marina TaxID=2292771 RepID=A0A371R7K9_9PROT|nr:hypothetical protein DX908_14085 [Parvularcula marina]